jgi:hypothetical protein
MYVCSIERYAVHSFNVSTAQYDVSTNCYCTSAVYRCMRTLQDIQHPLIEDITPGQQCNSSEHCHMHIHTHTNKHVNQYTSMYMEHETCTKSLLQTHLTAYTQV